MRTQSAEKKRQYLSFVFFALFCFAFWLFLCGDHFSGNEGNNKSSINPAAKTVPQFSLMLLVFTFFIYQFYF